MRGFALAGRRLGRVVAGLTTLDYLIVVKNRIF